MKKLLIMLILTSLLSGCMADGTPLDLIWPTKTSKILETYNQEIAQVGTNYVKVGSTPSIKFLGLDLTTVSIQDGAMQAAKFKKQLDDVHYATGLAEAYTYNSASRATQQGILGALAASGIVGAPLLYKLGLRKTRPGDISKEEHQRAVVKAGLQQPSEFKKTI